MASANLVVLCTLGLIASVIGQQAAATPKPAAPTPKPAAPAPSTPTVPKVQTMPEHYEFNYTVKNCDEGHGFYKHETGDGKSVQGEYRLHMPNRQTQIIKYTVNAVQGLTYTYSYEWTTDNGCNKNTNNIPNNNNNRATTTYRQWFYPMNYNYNQGGFQWTPIQTMPVENVQYGCDYC